MASYPSELSWLPDWRDASQYPPAEGTSGTRWAWEFLRRNPDYRKAYSELTHIISYGHRHESGSAPTDEEIMDETRRLFNICERFHLIDGVMPPDPKRNENPCLSFRAAWMRSYPYREKHPDQIITVPKGKILIEFDPSLPVETELQKARKILREHKREIDRFPTGKLADYLRILDANQDRTNPSLSDIALVIYPRETEGRKPARDNPVRNKVHENLQTALLYRDKNYWKLPTLA
ncbi:MAG: transcriptional regulator domain-containing protein [Leptospirillum sp.]